VASRRKKKGRSVKSEAPVEEDASSPRHVKSEAPVEDDTPIVISETTTTTTTKKAKPEKEDATRGSSTSDLGVVVTLEEPVTLSFALRYFNTFAKGGALSDRVVLHLAHDSPCMVEYNIEGLGYLRYYLAPKVDATDS